MKHLRTATVLMLALVAVALLLAFVTAVLAADPQKPSTCTGKYEWIIDHPSVVWDTAKGQIGLPGVKALMPGDQCADWLRLASHVDKRMPAQCISRAFGYVAATQQCTADDHKGPLDPVCCHAENWPGK